MLKRPCARILVAALALSVLPAANAASKEIQELQRDVAQLQDMIRQLQRTQDERFASLQTLVQQSLNAANDANKAVAVVQSTMQQNLREQGDKVVAPVVGLSKSLEEFGTDFRTMESAMKDLAAAVDRIQTQLSDLKTAVTVMQQPAAPPPPQSGAPQGASAEPPGTPAMSSTDMFAAAERDRLSNLNELALRGYSDFVRYYGDRAEAPRAQFYVGYLQYQQGAFAEAAKAFDTLLERYPSDNRFADQSFFYKGMSLLAMNQRDAAFEEFTQLAKQFPRSEFTKKGCEQVTNMGKKCPAARSAAPKKAAPRKK